MDDGFSDTYFEGLIKTIAMFVGELNFTDLKFDPQKEDKTGLQKAFGQVIFAAFVFIFVVVVMNLLNAVAIGDIQVSSCDVTKRQTHFTVALAPQNQND